MKYIILITMVSCTAGQPKQPQRTIIHVHADGSSTVYNKDDSSATIINLTKDGVLIDSTWMLTDQPLDSVIKYN